MDSSPMHVHKFCNCCVFMMIMMMVIFFKGHHHVKVPKAMSIFSSSSPSIKDTCRLSFSLRCGLALLKLSLAAEPCILFMVQLCGVFYSIFFVCFVFLFFSVFCRALCASTVSLSSAACSPEGVSLLTLWDQVTLLSTLLYYF